MESILNTLVEKLEKISGKKVIRESDEVFSSGTPVLYLLQYIFNNEPTKGLSLISKTEDSENLLKDAINTAEEEEEEYVEGVEYYDSYVFNNNGKNTEFDIHYKVNISIDYSYDPGVTRETPPSTSYSVKLEDKEIVGVYLDGEEFNNDSWLKTANDYLKLKGK